MIRPQQVRRRLADDLSGLTERLGGIDRAWGTAWNACDVDQLGELRRSIAVLAQELAAVVIH